MGKKAPNPPPPKNVKPPPLPNLPSHETGCFIPGACYLAYENGCPKIGNCKTFQEIKSNSSKTALKERRNRLPVVASESPLIEHDLTEEQISEILNSPSQTMLLGKNDSLLVCPCAKLKTLEVQIKTLKLELKKSKLLYAELAAEYVTSDLKDGKSSPSKNIAPAADEDADKVSGISIIKPETNDLKQAIFDLNLFMYKNYSMTNFTVGTISVIKADINMFLNEAESKGFLKHHSAKEFYASVRIYSQEPGKISIYFSDCFNNLVIAESEVNIKIDINKNA